MVRMCHAVCRSALERAVRDDLLRTNPAIGCKLPPKKAKEMQVLDREELQRFLIQAQADGYYELFLLDLCTGLRRGELIALQWDDLNFETGVLTVNKQAYDGKRRIADHPAQNQGVHPKTGAAACGAGRAAGVPKDGGFPLDVSVPGEGGSTDHTRRGAHGGFRRYWSGQTASVSDFMICGTPSRRWRWKTAWM